MRRLLAAALLLPLAGCADDQESYCDEVQARQEELTEIITGGGQDALLRALPIFEDLRDSAPGDVRDEWDVVVQTLDELRAALDDADLDPASYDKKNLPASLSDEQHERIEAAADGVASQEMAAALAGVDQQVRDVCHVPLSL